MINTDVGRIPARLDDAVNFIPARISGLLMILCAFLSGYNGRGTAGSLCGIGISI